MGGNSSQRDHYRDLSSAKKGETDCSKLSFSTHLDNVSDSIKLYKKGDVLTLRLTEKKVVAAYGDHGYCGTLSNNNALQVLGCIKKGHEFNATITNIEGFSCIVNVTPIN